MAILRSVWQKLLRNNSLATATPESHTPAAPLLVSVSTIAKTSKGSAPKPESAPNPIPAQYLPLSQLLDQRQFIEVKVDGNSHNYQTLVLAIDVKRGLLWLDDLFPNQNMLEIGDQITLRHHRNGEQLSFSSPIVAFGSSYGATGLAVVLPELLSYKPRRQFRRANMSDKPSLTLKLKAVGQDVSYGNILDISCGGLRASIPGNLFAHLRHGALLPLCELRLSDELTLRCSARVRSFRLLRTPHRHTQVSIEFIDLPAERVQQLQQFINNLIYLQQSENMPVLRSA